MEQPIILNLGCGTKTAVHPAVTNIDFSMHIRLKSIPVVRSIAPLLMDNQRRKHFRSIPDNVRYLDLTKGLPYDSESVDVVYHSHLLEHFDRDTSEVFLAEVKRILKAKGIQRIVVPDLETACRDYVGHIDLCDSGPGDLSCHDEYVAEIVEQMVRREAIGTERQKPIRRWIENRILGDARRRGETHQWMYDRLNLKEKLLRIGFREVQIHKFDTSLVPSWNELGLDLDDAGNEFRSNSLYVEAVK
jgi:SAM-dependent methyltransferase